MTGTLDYQTIPNVSQNRQKIHLDRSKANGKGPKTQQEPMKRGQAKTNKANQKAAKAGFQGKHYYT